MLTRTAVLALPRGSLGFAFWVFMVFSNVLWLFYGFPVFFWFISRLFGLTYVFGLDCFFLSPGFFLANPRRGVDCEVMDLARVFTEAVGC